MNLPRFTNTFDAWQESVILMKYEQTIVDFQAVNRVTEYKFKGVVQNLKNQELIIKPIEERSWNWLQIHTKTKLAIETNDRIKYKSKNYKIMLQNDYSSYGYYEYQVIEDYE